MIVTVKKLNQRLDQLIDAHAWSRENNKVHLNVFQRICISQERAAIMQLLDDVSFVSTASDYPVDTKKLKYQLPEHLDWRIQQITTIIKETQWEKPEHVAEPY